MARNKVGRNKDKCNAYRLNGTRGKNKKRKLLKHFRDGKNTNDKCAKAALNKL